MSYRTRQAVCVINSIAGRLPLTAADANTHQGEGLGDAVDSEPANQH
ncbi:hypothetical protein [Streptomyces adustus]